MSTKVYIVGITLSEDGGNWGLVGVFDEEKEKEAIKACRTPNHFVATVMTNIDYGDEIEYFPDTIYPLSVKGSE